MRPARGSTRPVLGTVLAAALLASAGCSGGGSNTIAAQANVDRPSYVAGDGTVQTIPASGRRLSIAVSGRTLDGARLDTADYRGKVVVINAWGSWCPPCRTEAPVLERTWVAVKDEGVQFVGVDLRESPAAGLAFQRTFKITYPSLAWDGGGVLLQLKGKAVATPTTLVLDRQGRLAGRISGATTGTTLLDLVRGVLAEGPTSTSGS